MDTYTFGLAKLADETRIKNFMQKHWGAPHPLVQCQNFFNFYYKTHKNRLNFALCEKEGELAAIAGYIPANSGKNPDAWVSIWLADKAQKGSGIELMDAMPKLLPFKSLACNNIKPKTRPFYHFLGYKTGKMGHFYRLADKPKYSLAVVIKKDIPPVFGGAELLPIKNGQALWQSGFVPPQNANPCKDMWYILRRYFAYPGQTYTVHALVVPGQSAPCGLLCTRTINAGGVFVLRIADYIGNAEMLPKAGVAIAQLMQKENAEYADFYCAGIDPNLLRQAGFAERQECSENIIPNYLNPPLIENTDYYYFTNNAAGFAMFKADGDQDRPNIF